MVRKMGLVGALIVHGKGSSIFCMFRLKFKTLQCCECFPLIVALLEIHCGVFKMPYKNSSI